jgi:hypothetical protein
MNLKSTFLKLAVILLLTQSVTNISFAGVGGYCSPSFVNSCFSWSNQSIGLDSINWTLTDCTLSDFTSMSTTVTPGDSVAMSVTSGDWCGCSVWIDFNQDFAFDTIENLFHNYNGNQTYTYNFYIHIPPGLPPGSYRMRVLAGWGSDGYTEGSGNGWGPCGSYQYGNFDDFTINVAGGCVVAAVASDTVVCRGDSVILSGLGANMTFAWNNGVSNDVAFVPDSTMTYTVTGTDITTTCIATDTITVVVNPLPVITFLTSNDTMVCWNSPIFSILVDPPGGTLTGAAVIASSNNFDPGNATPGSNVVTYSYTDGNGCSNADSISILVEFCEGIDDPSSAFFNVHLYPVPASNYLDIDLPKSSKEITMTLFSLDGKLMLEQTLLNGTNRINMQSIAAGVYSLQMKNTSGVETRKITVVK